MIDFFKEKLKRFWKVLRKNTSLMVGFWVLVAMVVFYFFVPYVYPHEPLTMNFGAILSPPSASNLAGTDEFGRDVLSRVMRGGQLSLMVGAFTMALTTVLGGVIGLVAGYFLRLDFVLMRIMDALMSFPSLVLALAILAALGSNMFNVVIALSIVYTPRTARVVRSTVLSIKDEFYVEAARGIGASTFRVLFFHVLPASMPSLIVQQTFVFAYAILGEAGLSFVGIGVQPPAPSLGNILGDARALIQTAPWLVFAPGVAIIIAVFSLNLVGDGMREVLDPKRQNIQ
jgi:peptide/nickel transport system permease protein